jgi:hypothetical protein
MTQQQLNLHILNQENLCLNQKKTAKENDQLKIMPVSVIEIGPQKKRIEGRHSTKSSRSEYSPFPKEVSDLCYEFFLRNSNKIFDCFAGWGDRAEKAIEWNKSYIGYDISEKVIRASRDRGIQNILANSLVADIPEHDGLITCPPYWNLESYSDNGIEATRTWEKFKLQYSQILKRCWTQAKSGSTYCIMVGEWRKNHKFYDLEYVTRKIFDELGAILFDQVVISRKKISKIKIMLPQAKRLGYSVRVHESLLVFKKH